MSQLGDGSKCAVPGCPCGGLDGAILGENDVAYHIPKHSNQSTLNNGCVCDSGCDQCDRLAEAFDSMRTALSRIEQWHGEFPPVKGRDGKPSTYAIEYGSNGERDYMRALATDALALADKVTR